MVWLFANITNKSGQYDDLSYDGEQKKEYAVTVITTILEHYGFNREEDKDYVGIRNNAIGKMIK